MKVRLLDLVLQLHHETVKAVLVSTAGQRANAVWLPKSRVEVAPYHGNPNFRVVTLPEALAVEKGIENGERFQEG